MSYRPFCFIFKNVLFFIYCREQNTKEIISLRRCYLLIKTWRSILKWCRITMFLKQLSSSNNRLAPKTSAKIFSPAFWLIPLPQQNSKLNSLSTLYKPTTIRLGKLNDCKKTCFFLHSLDVTNLTMRHETLGKSWLGFLADQLFLNCISVPIISWLEDWYCLHSSRSSKWKLMWDVRNLGCIS